MQNTTKPDPELNKTKTEKYPTKTEMKITKNENQNRIKQK